MADDDDSMVGTKVWVADAEHAWVQGVIHSTEAGSYSVKLNSGGIKSVAVESLKECNQFEDEKNGLLGVNDLTTLTHLHEPALLEALSQRFRKNTIYTNTGPILLAVNPFQLIEGLYSKDQLQNYWTAGLLVSQIGDAADSSIRLPPHIYKTADSAYRSLVDEDDFSSGGNSLNTNEEKENDFFVRNKNQSILVSGESGAGKTESTKHIMNYLATVANQHEEVLSEGKKQSHRQKIAEMVLNSNPILESFGNARTIRNDNSSRFGKFIEMQFNLEGQLVGARIKTYLLEKVRINSQSKGERNFHVFYQLFKGSDAELKKELKLDQLGFSLKKCNLTNQSGCYERQDGVDDSKMLNGMLSAMKTMNFTKSEVDSILKTIAAVMHLSNVTFAEKMVDGNHGSMVDIGKIDNKARIEIVSELLELQGNDGNELENFEEALTRRKRFVGKEVFQNVLNETDAEAARNAVVKTIYSRLFDWIVQRVNQSIEFDPNDQGSFTMNSSFDNQLSFIGVLDIFGFEVFEKNSFEQLCINYANETLQQQFNQHIFKLEQIEYEKEKIEWKAISFPDNETVLRLIDGKPIGVLSLLDEQCMFPNGNDEGFARKLYENLGESDDFSASVKEKVDFNFSVCHYAGEVKYDTQGFCEKNKDQLFQEALNLLQTSSNDLLSTLFPNGEKTGLGISKSKSIQAITVGTQFKNQLGDLLGVIRATRPHYVRCLKPNDENIKSKLNRQRLLDQLRYGGVLEAVKVARAGYPVRMPLQDFVLRYKFMSSKDSSNENVSEMAEKEFGLQKMEEFQIGLTKVFLRKTAYEKLEHKRTILRKKKAIVLQKNFKMYIVRAHYVQMKKAALLLQRQYKMYRAKILVESLRRKVRAICIQRSIRMYVQRQKYLRIKKSTQMLQNMFRVFKAKRAFLELRTRKGVSTLQKFARMAVIRIRYLQTKRKIIKLQRRWRMISAKKHLRELKKEARQVGSLQQRLDDLREKNKQLVEDLNEERERTAKFEKLVEELQEEKSGDEELEIVKQQMLVLRKENSKVMEELDKLRNENIQLKRSNDEAKVTSSPMSSPRILGEDSDDDSISEKDEMEHDLEYWRHKMGGSFQEKVEDKIEPVTTQNLTIESTAAAKRENELNERVEQLEAENQRLNSMLDARPVPAPVVPVTPEVETSASDGPQSAAVKVSSEQQQEASEGTQTEREESRIVVDLKGNIRDLELALEEMAQENKDYKRANYELQDRMKSYIERMCEAENRCNELDATVRESTKALDEMKQKNKDLTESSKTLRNKVEAMEVIAEQSSGVKIALAKRLEELLSEKKKLKMANIRFREKLNFINETNQVLQAEIDAHKKKRTAS